MSLRGEVGHTEFTRAPNGGWLIKGQPPENVLTDAELAAWYRAEAEGARAEKERRLRSAQDAAESNAQVWERNVNTALEYAAAKAKIADEQRAKADASQQEAATYARSAATNERTASELRAEMKASREEAEAYARMAAASERVANELRAEKAARPRNAARAKQEQRAAYWQPWKARFHELRRQGLRIEQARLTIRFEMSKAGLKTPGYKTLERQLKDIDNS